MSTDPQALVALKPKRRPRLTDDDWRTICRVLNDAMDERSSYADAWAPGTPERAEANRQVKRFEALHVKLFGGPSSRQRQADEFAAMPSVPITSLMGGKS